MILLRECLEHIDHLYKPIHSYVHSISWVIVGFSHKITLFSIKNLLSPLCYIANYSFASGKTSFFRPQYGAVECLDGFGPR